MNPVPPAEPVRKRPKFQRVRNYLLAGILVTAPIAITAWLTMAVVRFFDRLVASWFPKFLNYDPVIPIALPGLGLLIVVATLILIGFLTANLFGRFLVRLVDRFVYQIPVVNKVYRTIKQIFGTVLENSSQAFRQVVLIEYPRKGLWAIGFLTSDAPPQIPGSEAGDLVSVFLPTTPNPTSGFLLYVKRGDLQNIDLSVEEGIKLVVSSGIVIPERSESPSR